MKKTNKPKQTTPTSTDLASFHIRLTITKVCNDCERPLCMKGICQAYADEILGLPGSGSLWLVACREHADELQGLLLALRNARRIAAPRLMRGPLPHEVHGLGSFEIVGLPDVELTTTERGQA